MPRALTCQLMCDRAVDDACETIHKHNMTFMHTLYDHQSASFISMKPFAAFDQIKPFA
jgi:hypothetical protein